MAIHKYSHNLRLRSYLHLCLFSLFSLLFFQNCSVKNIKLLDIASFQAGRKKKVTASVYAKTGLTLNLLFVRMEGYSAISPDGDRSSQERWGLETQKLGNFEVLSYVDSTFRKSADQLQYFQFYFADSLSTIEHTAKRFAGRYRKFDTLISGEHQKAGSEYLAAFKVVYGIGMRANNENLGFSKTYRPFIMVKGAIRNSKTDQLMWENHLIEFSPSVIYNGQEAVFAADGPQLINEYKLLGQRVVAKLVNSLNGVPVENVDVFPKKYRPDFWF